MFGIARVSSSNLDTIAPAPEMLNSDGIYHRVTTQTKGSDARKVDQQAMHMSPSSFGYQCNADANCLTEVPLDE